MLQFGGGRGGISNGSVDLPELVNAICLEARLAREV